MRCPRLRSRGQRRFRRTLHRPSKQRKEKRPLACWTRPPSPRRHLPAWLQGPNAVSLAKPCARDSSLPISSLPAFSLPLFSVPLFSLLATVPASRLSTSLQATLLALFSRLSASLPVSSLPASSLRASEMPSSEAPRRCRRMRRSMCPSTRWLSTLQSSLLLAYAQPAASVSRAQRRQTTARHRMLPASFGRVRLEENRARESLLQPTKRPPPIRGRDSFRPFWILLKRRVSYYDTTTTILPSLSPIGVSRYRRPRHNGVSFHLLTG